MSYSAKVIADSINPFGNRLTTLQVTFPRFILAELNTHRVLSRNSASSRAIPPEKLIARVLAHPFVPEVFYSRAKGMGQGEALDDQDKARRLWLSAMRASVLQAKSLVKLDVAKATVNRLLEPFLWHTALVSGTEWSNFYALRQPDNDYPVPQIDHGAQPEFQIIARMMRDVMEESDPVELNYGDWHLPYVRADLILSEAPYYWPNVSAGRCFTVSYDRLDEIMDEDPMVGYRRSERGRSVGHWSPLEHPAQACPGRHGNFVGFKQLRKFYPYEDDYAMVLPQEQSV